MPNFNYSLFLTTDLGKANNSNTNLLCVESINRGYKTYTFDTNGIFFKNNKVFAECYSVSINKNKQIIIADKSEVIDLADNHIINLRLDPPFDSNYYTAMNLLSYASKGSLLANDPKSINNWPEKNIPSELLNFTPKTIITSNLDKIKDFWAEQEDIIIKPLYEFGGRSVFRLQKGDENYKTILQVIAEKYNEPVIAQKYIPEVKQGDKRIVLLDGEFFGAFNRIAPKGQLQAAISQGGTITHHELTKNEIQICNILKPMLKKDDIFLCGLDVIGDYITEINVTCPVAFVALNKLAGKVTEAIYWDKLEAKLNEKNSK